jgi:hypothetical protein
LPPWCEVTSIFSPPDSGLAYLDPGEREAIQIALEREVDLLLMDERKGRREAKRRGLATTGTLGVLLRAGELGLVNPVEAFHRLRMQTSFRTSSTLESQFLDLVSLTASPASARYRPQPDTPKIKPPVRIIHCDWSVNESGRWMAEAALIDGKYHATAPKPVDDPSSLLRRIQTESGPVLIGFDFPIGIPKAYAGKRGIIEFIPFLKSLVLNPPNSRSLFFEVCEHEEEICLERPFYPHAPGGKLQEHLSRALGIEFSGLLRCCDRAQNGRPAAAALFWTLGAKQVGKAAIAGWGHALAPALRAEEISVWPFHGHLDSLLQKSALVATETYPAEYYAGIFAVLNGPKSDRNARAEAAPRILQWVNKRADYLQLELSLRSEIEDGFNAGSDDAFDAAIGLFGMIDAIQNFGPHLEPIDPTIRNIEGWILGQPAP